MHQFQEALAKGEVHKEGGRGSGPAGILMHQFQETLGKVHKEGGRGYGQTLCTSGCIRNAPGRDMLSLTASLCTVPGLPAFTKSAFV